MQIEREMVIFDLQPILIGELVLLRPLVPDDFNDLYLVASDPLVWEQHPEKNRYQRNVFERFFQAAIASKGALAVIDRTSGKIIGSSRFYDFDSNRNRITIGYTFLSRAHWGGKYNTEMKSLMLNHACRFVESVTFSIGEQNLRSRRAIEKLGAYLIDRVEEKWPDGLLKVSVVYEIKTTQVVRRLLVEISSDKNRLDLDVVHQFISTSYWAKGRERKIIEKSIDGSFCLGLYAGEKQIGFCRSVTDQILFGYIFDVFVLKEYRGRGLGKLLMKVLLEWSEFKAIKWMLKTTDAGPLYEQLGFNKMASSEGVYTKAPNFPVGSP